jgi:hypothetical protein
LTDDLAATFAPGTPRVTIVSGPSIEGGNASLTLAASYDGAAATALLSGSDTMLPGTEQRIALTVRVRYDSASSIPVGVDLNNSAVASTSVAPGGTIIMSTHRPTSPNGRAAASRRRAETDDGHISCRVRG